MRHLRTTLAAAAFVVGLGLDLGQTNATPFPIGFVSQPSPVETIGYYGYPCVGSCRYYRYWYPWYYKPYYYGYRYKPYYGHYGYRYRPYHRRRHWYW
jgi:hypothetical protein